MGGRLDLRWASTSFSKHLVMMVVSATDQNSEASSSCFCLSTGMMVMVLRQFREPVTG